MDLSSLRRSKCEDNEVVRSKFLSLSVVAAGDRLGEGTKAMLSLKDFLKLQLLRVERVWMAGYLSRVGT